MNKSLPITIRKITFINNVWIERGERACKPGHGVVVSSVILCGSADVDLAVSAARQAFENVWAETPGAERGRILIKAAQGIRDRLDEMAYWETLETGKPISQAKAEIDAAADHYEAAAGMARMVSGETHNTYGEGMIGLVTKQPIGVVGLITPWNFPFIVLAERLPFILAAGCTVVLKPSEMTSTTSLIFADILNGSGLPKGVYNVVTGSGPVVGEAMSKHLDIDMISFTGSTAVGERVLEASKSNLKKVGLELGGKNPQVVFADANLEDAVDGVAFIFASTQGSAACPARLILKLPSPTNLKRSQLRSQVKIGDPLDPDTQMGAIVTPQHFNKILDYIEKDSPTQYLMQVAPRRPRR